MSEIDRQGDRIVIKIDEDIVAPMSIGLRPELQTLLEEAPQELVVDLSLVEMIDSVGLGVLVATHNSLQESGGRLTVTNASDDIFSLLKTMRLDKHFEIQAAA